MADKDQENFFRKTFITPFKTSPVTSVIFLGLIGLIIYQQLPLFFNNMKMTGNPAPDFVLKDLNGNFVRLSDLKGKKIAINFWATWCAPCRVEIPVLNSIYPDINNDSFVLLGISSEDHNEIEEFVKLNPMSYTILVDDNYTTANDYSILAYPTFVYIDENGIITDIDSGVNFFLKWKLKYYAKGSIF